MLEYDDLAGGNTENSVEKLSTCKGGSEKAMTETISRKGLEYSFKRPIEPDRLRRLMLQTSWGKKRTADGLRIMLDSTPVKLGVWDDGHLVGFARAISDNVYRALIEDVVVDTPLRGKAIGTAIMRKMVQELSRVEDVYLFTGEGSQAMRIYERIGFHKTPYLSMRFRNAE